MKLNELLECQICHKRWHKFMQYDTGRVDYNDERTKCHCGSSNVKSLSKKDMREWLKSEIGYLETGNCPHGRRTYAYVLKRIAKMNIKEI